MTDSPHEPNAHAEPKSADLQAAGAPEEAAAPPSAERYFTRLSITIRAQHIVLMASCVLLIVSGLPLRYPDSRIAHFLFGVTGGVRAAGLAHRIGAAALIAVGFFHLFYILFTREGRGEFVQLLPRLRDFRDLGQNVAHFFDLRRTRARFGRWSYIQKFDYWAVYWGMVIMIGTGLVLWFENTAMALLPKFMLDIAHEAHSDEALLATLAIIVWHMYNVHLSPSAFPMSKVWLTGRISERELREQHPLEYERLIAEGVVPWTPPARRPVPAPAERPAFSGAWAFAAILTVVVIVNSGLWLLVRTRRGAEQTGPAATIAERERAAASGASSRRVHPADFVRTHPPHSRRAAEQCHRCHEPSFCVSCHKTARPANHSEPNWASHHSWAVAQPQRKCQTCHRNDFCLTCHQTQRPASHGKRWQQLHGKSSLRDEAKCALCHTQEYCDRCHGGVAMPHPDTYTAKHQPAAKRDQRPCLKCHQQSECLTCHRGTKPQSHTPRWMQQHGRWALAKKQNCSLCHGQALCSTCHRGVEMPHPRNWTASKHQPAAKKESTACAACHKQDECLKCHGLPMPHPGDWLARHGVEADKAAATCARCHEPGAKPYCLKCHQAMPPASHTEQFKKDHAAPAKNATLCALCHESSRNRDACLTCHRVAMPHPADFAVAHAKVASFKPDSACLRCHTRETTCNTCHGG